MLNQGRTKGWLILLDLIKVACTASIRTLFSLIKISLFLCFKQVKTGQRNLRGSVFDRFVSGGTYYIIMTFCQFNRK